jgi:hypothetical protein
VRTALGTLAAFNSTECDVRFTPESGHSAKLRPCPLSAKSGHRLTIEPAENPAGDSIVIGNVIRRPLFLTRADDL